MNEYTSSYWITQGNGYLGFGMLYDKDNCVQWVIS